LLIYDWKRCKEIVKENAYGSTATTECIRHLPDTNFWHYALQLNTYKTIIEEKYGKKVVGLCLVCLHPNNADYQLIEVPFMEKELVDLFEYRKEMVVKQALNAKPLSKTSAVKASAVKTSAEKASVTNYFKPVEKKGSGLLINLNNI